MAKRDKNNSEEVKDLPLSGVDSRPIAKKSVSVNIGSINGGKDRIIELVEGKELPSEVEEKFFSSLKTEGII